MSSQMDGKGRQGCGKRQQQLTIRCGRCAFEKRQRRHVRMPCRFHAMWYGLDGLFLAEAVHILFYECGVGSNSRAKESKVRRPPE